MEEKYTTDEKQALTMRHRDTRALVQIHQKLSLDSSLVQQFKEQPLVYWRNMTGFR